MRAEGEDTIAYGLESRLVCEDYEATHDPAPALDINRLTSTPTA
jgi:hypothetical protein